MGLRFFFGYHSYHGQWWPIMWPEDGGITVGGRPVDVVQRTEITPEEAIQPLSELVKKFPRIEVDPSTPKPEP